MNREERIKKEGERSGGIKGLIHSTFVKTLGEFCLNFVLGFILATARIMSYLSPFGLAFVGRVRLDGSGICGLLGTSLGYLFMGGFDWGIRYVTSLMLIFTIGFVFRDLKIRNKGYFMPVVVTLVTGVTAYLNSFAFIDSFPTGAKIFMEVILSGACTYFFAQALTNEKILTEEQERKRLVGLAILFAALLISLSDIYIINVISVGRLFSVILIMAMAYKGGMSLGCMLGTTLGLAMDMATGSKIFYTMAYAFSGLIGGSFKKHGRLLFLVSYVIANAVSVLWTLNFAFPMELMYEVFAGAVIFVLIPQKALDVIFDFAQLPIPATGESGLRHYAAHRAKRISNAFRELYETVFESLNGNHNDNDIASIFDRAAENVCATCRHKKDCWEENYADTLNVMNNASSSMLKRGSLKSEDLDQRFLEKCKAHQSFILSVNTELRGLMYRRQFRSRLNENRAAAYGQYKELADIIDEVSEELDNAKGADPLSERRLKRFLRSIDIDAEVSVFRDKKARLRCII